MIKGKTIIELKNIKTGEVERYEDHNMVTNALNHLFEPLGHYKKPDRLFTNSDVVPYYQNLLGGLLMFDGAIPENAEQLFPPASVRMTACGVYGVQNDTECLARGDFNVTESEVNLEDKYVKYVYDFATSQGNGVIASVALSGKNAGYCAYGAEDATLKMSATGMYFNLTDITLNFMTQTNCAKKGGSCTLGVTLFLFAIDAENDILYYLRVNSTKSISIVKRRGFFKSVGVFDRPANGGTLIDTIDLADMATGFYSTSSIYYNYNVTDGCLYIYSSQNSTVSAGGTFNVIKVDLSDNTITEYTIRNLTNKSIYVTHYSTYVYGDHIYVRNSSTPYSIYKIALTNPSDVREIEMPSAVQNLYMTPCFAVNGWIFYDTYSHNSMSSTERVFVLNTEDEDILPFETRFLYGNVTTISADGVPLIGHPECMYHYGYIVYPAIYLATINNLDAPVTKTADKTMKVTYIIREHAE